MVAGLAGGLALEQPVALSSWASVALRRSGAPTSRLTRAWIVAVRLAGAAGDRVTSVAALLAQALAALVGGLGAGAKA